MNRNKIQLENLIDFESDAIITLGTRITADNTSVQKYIKGSLHKKETSFIYMHPIDDISLQDQYTQYIKYEAGSEEGVLALLSYYLIKHSTPEYQAYLDDLDIGNLSGETSVGEEEFEQLAQTLEGKKNTILIIGEDIYGHESFPNIVNFIRLIDIYTDIHVILLGQKSKIDLSKKIALQEISPFHTYNGTVIYTLPLHNGTNDQETLKGSGSFATAAKIKDGDTVDVVYEGYSERKKFKVDPTIRGTIALYGVVSSKHENTIVSGYRFKRVQIQKVNL